MSLLTILAKTVTLKPLVRPGALFGSTTIAGTPEAAVPRRVQLFVSQNAHGQVFPSNTLVDWCWSDAAGDWHFDNLDPTKKYHVIAYDHTGVHDPVIKLNLVPSVEE
ncbi:hypothetical protein [Aromatoleum aromaticum]|uniref:hypothetical protein n=1 Tax=Aromatoleum aromaticum TaxID=551760 RepID=UPI0005A1A2E5|nr:hypothetical protein [Aromatoleum aromaticum]NMG56642.1 hypothetical protein [Aromatoleum aromaticum]